MQERWRTSDTHRAYLSKYSLSGRLMIKVFPTLWCVSSYIPQQIEVTREENGSQTEHLIRETQRHKNFSQPEQELKGPSGLIECDRSKKPKHPPGVNTCTDASSSRTRTLTVFMMTLDVNASDSSSDSNWVVTGKGIQAWALCGCLFWYFL